MASLNRVASLRKEKGSVRSAAFWGIYSANCESFVVNISTYKNFVGQSAGDSLAFLRCLRLISPNIANEINCPVLSPGVFTSSMSLIISCAIRAVTDCDFVFFGPVAISTPFDFWCKTIYTQIYLNKSLKCKTPASYCVSYTLVVSRSEVTTSQGATNTNGTSIHNVTETYAMALQHSTQTRPEKKYLWRFLALNRSDMSAKPCRISVEAPTEHDARRVLAPLFILSLSARLSAQGVCNV